jgi:hypothetical protein
MPADTARLRRLLLAVLAVLFLLVWGSALVSGLAFRGCVERAVTDPRKRGYCTVAITAGAVIDLIPSERAKRAPLRLERGRLLAAAGEDAAARAAFRAAILDAAQAGRSAMVAYPAVITQPRVAPLFAAMQREPAEGAAAALWLSTLRDLACGHPGTDAPDLCRAS